MALSKALPGKALVGAPGISSEMRRHDVGVGSEEVSWKRLLSELELASASVWGFT